MSEPEPSSPATLRGLSELPSAPARFAESTLVVIDCQNTYTGGPLELDGVEAALDHAAGLLRRARTAGIPVVHVRHDDGAGSLFDIRGETGAIVERVAPHDDEPVITKSYPNAFVDTDLRERLTEAGNTNLIMVGFMTHMCVNSTARAAFNLGYASTVVAAATATRALPGPTGTLAAATIQAASLAAINDLFGIVVPDHSAIPD
ncbi:cysteine hydrolase family protein [Pseudonocardia sp. TRM90224]|uniref:cysteine hydrolase family protein n=1 Tax=Pseudonocardia sp. TRM90224 TaxID=2812678 RepID=UPI001E451C5C|nr:cysteine hydrolase family protein [Pseudonocardia sp. TRM90224]